MSNNTLDSAAQKRLEYFNGDELAADVFLKYALRDEAGNLLEETPEQMHKRLAKEFARIEAKYPNPLSEEEIYSHLVNFSDIIPQGSPMSGVGNPHQIQSLSNCFVIDPPQDSYGGILYTDQEQAQIMKRRGGVGFDLSTIRPKGLPTKNAARTTDGIGVFMERFSNTCREVAQGGRRGALMLTISCNHPEIETFIDIKRDLKKVTGANISIRFTDEFMNAAKAGTEYVLRWPVDATPANAKITKTVNARDVWNKFVEAAWASAEPGALFWDTAVNNTPSDIYSKFGYNSVSTNPCGEIVLSAYDSCRLLVLNLTSFVVDPFLPTAKFDYPRFFKVARKAQRLMDDLIELEVECVDKILAKIDADPQPESVKAIERNLWEKIKGACLNGRRTGLGITGLGDTLAGVGLVYGSPESISETEKIYKTMAVAAHTESCHLARERGAFPVFNYEMEKGHAYLSKVMEACGPEVIELWKTTGRRNISLTTTAPTGSVSILTGTTSGIEPAFLLSYKRRRKINPNDVATRVDFVDALGDKWVEYTVYHPWFKKWMDATGKTEAQDSPYWKATANDVNWVASADIQAAAQRWIDHSISKTVNLPNSATKELVSEVYMRAWELGCKGFTVYRDGCRTGVLVSTEEAPKKAETSNRDAPKRPKSLPADIHKVSVKNDGEPESWLVIVGLNDGNPYEIFCGLSQHVEVPKRYKSGNIVKNGKVNGISTYNLVVPIAEGDNLVFKDVVNLFDNPTQGAFTRTISLALRHGVGLHWIVDQLQKDKSSDMFSFAKVIARVLKGYIKDGTKHASEKGCPQCGSNELVYQEGCLSCKQCGWGKC